MQSSTILEVKITSEKKEDILEYLFSRLQKPGEKTFIITPNPEMLTYASSHLAYKDKLNYADIALPDGIGLFFAAGLLGERLEERITGVEFIEDLCKASAELPLSMGFLGGKAGVADLTAECLLRKYPYLNIVFVGAEWNEAGFRFKKRNQESGIRNQGRKNIDILFVAFGVPKQEEWIYEHLDKIPVKAAIGVGGAFDFLSGSVIRAPFIIRYAGLEWLFRLIVQPWRWKRQLALIEFIRLIFKEKFSAR